MRKVLELQFSLCKVTTSKFMPYCLFSISILNTIETRGVVVKFHIKKVVHMGGMSQSKGLTQNKKKNYAQF